MISILWLWNGLGFTRTILLTLCKGINSLELLWQIYRPLVQFLLGMNRLLFPVRAMKKHDFSSYGVILEVHVNSFEQAKSSVHIDSSKKAIASFNMNPFEQARISEYVVIIWTSKEFSMHGFNWERLISFNMNHLNKQYTCIISVHVS